MNPGSLWNLYLVFRSLAPPFYCYIVVIVSPLCESVDPVGIFCTLELVYFSIFKKSLMTIVVLFRNLLLIVASLCDLWFILADCWILSKAPHKCLWMESPVDRLDLAHSEFLPLAVTRVPNGIPSSGRRFHPSGSIWFWAVLMMSPAGLSPTWYGVDLKFPTVMTCCSDVDPQ